MRVFGLAVHPVDPIFAICATDELSKADSTSDASVILRIPHTHTHTHTHLTLYFHHYDNTLSSIFVNTRSFCV